MNSSCFDSSAPSVNSAVSPLSDKHATKSTWRGFAPNHRSGSAGAHAPFGGTLAPSTLLSSSLLSLLLVSALPACERPAPLPPAVASLGDEHIRIPELEAELVRMRRESDLDPMPLDQKERKALALVTLNQLIDKRLLLAESLRQGLEVSDDELEEAITLRVNARDPETDELDERQTASESLAVVGAKASDGAGSNKSLRGGLNSRLERERIRNQLLVDKLLFKEVLSRVALGPDDAREYYEANPELFQREEEVRCQQLLVPTRELAENIRQKLVRGADFAELALEHSTTPDARKGGDLGFFPRGSMPEIIETSCFALRPNQLSEVVESPYGFQLFRRSDSREGGLLPFEEVEQAIEIQLTREAVAQEQERHLAKLRQKAEVVIHHEALEASANNPARL